MTAHNTNDVPRIAHVSLKTLTEAIGPKAVRFDGKTFSDLKGRLASAGFPGYAEDSFVQVLDESQQFICILDDELLPPGDLYVEVHNYTKGLEQQKLSPGYHTTPPPPFRHHLLPYVAPGFLAPLLQGQDIPWLDVGRHHHRKGSSLHKGAGDESSHHHFKHHHHHDRHSEHDCGRLHGGRQYHPEHTAESGNNKHHGHHHDDQPMEFGSGRRHGHHHHHDQPAQCGSGRHHGHHHHHDHSTEFGGGRHHGHHHHHDHHVEHGFQAMPAFVLEPHYHHKSHRHGRCGHPRGASPISLRPISPTPGMHGPEAHPTMMQGRHRHGVEARDMSGFDKGEHGCLQPRKHAYYTREGPGGMRGRCHRWASPRHCRMKGPHDHLSQRRGRSHSPSARRFGRERKSHCEEDLGQDFEKMTLERHGHEECVTANPASQAPVASSSRGEPLTYAFAQHDGLHGDVHREEEWDDVVYVNEE